MWAGITVMYQNDEQKDDFANLAYRPWCLKSYKGLLYVNQRLEGEKVKAKS